MQTSTPSSIHLWIPDAIAGHGGIQSFSQRLATALAEAFPSSRLTILCKNDPTDEARRILPPNAHFEFAGYSPKQFRTAYFAAKLAKRAILDRPDLILSAHVNFSPVARLLKRWLGIPYAVVAHGVDVWGLKNASVAKGIAAADQVLAVSRFTKKSLTDEQSLPADKVTVFPNTVDGSRFFPTGKPPSLMQRYGLTPDQPVLLTITRLASEERYKGYEQVLATLGSLRRSIPNLHYILGGKGEDRPRVERMIADLGLTECVTLAGFIADEELNDHYNLCDVFVMPSRKEGFGIVYLEAMAAGKPVIAGNLDGSVDPLLDGDLGVLIDPSSLAELETALRQVLTGSHPLQILCEPSQLRERVMDTFGFDRFVLNTKSAVLAILHSKEAS